MLPVPDPRACPAAAPGIQPPTADLLTTGGDARIALDAESGSNRYGCRPFPDPDLLPLGSSTASVISEAGFAAAADLRGLITDGLARMGPAAIYAEELDRVRRELASLCGVSEVAGLEIVFAASGTDLHLIAGQLAGASSSEPVLAVMVDAAETGSRVPIATAGRHFSDRAALAEKVEDGVAIAGAWVVNVATVPIRLADGQPRPAAAVDAEFESVVAAAATRGRRVLLVVAESSKTGLVAPSPACALALRRRFPDVVEVLVDACQFRIGPSTLRRYLELGFAVAITGSKFVTGPTFSGALLLPRPVADRLRRQPLPGGLRTYSTRADWPAGWDPAAILDDTPNFGLLLRWQAALADLRAFRAVPEERVEAFLSAFAEAIGGRLASHPLLWPLPVPPIDRGALFPQRGWDTLQTVYPFVPLHPGSSGTPLTRAQTAEVHRRLQAAPEPRGPAAGLRFQLGQAVACGHRLGVPMSALRLCASARLVVEATRHDGRDTDAVIGRALAALDATARLVGEISAGA